MLAALKNRAQVGRPFVQLGQDRKANLELESLRAPSKLSLLKQPSDGRCLPVGDPQDTHATGLVRLHRRVEVLIARNRAVCIKKVETDLSQT